MREAEAHLEDDISPPVGRSRGPLAPLVFSTTELPPEDQFEAWRDHCRSVIEMTEALGPGAGFEARFRMWSFGHFALAVIEAPPCRFQRTRSQIRRDSLDLWQIHVPRTGSLRLRTEAAQIAVPTGHPHILSLDRAFDGDRTGGEWLWLFVSRDAFPGLGPTIDACRDTPLGSAMGRLLGNYIESLADSLETMTEAELPRAAEATRALLSACIAPSSPLNLDADAHVERARLGRIRQTIRQNLRSTRLGPERLCKLAGVSRSQLYRLFEPFGGVARYIQSERLRQAHQALSDPSNTRDIIKVAEDFGFFDPSAFSRAFRREFDYSPTQLRQAAQSGWVAAPIRKRAGPAGGHDFASALRLI
ncbi:helix-turn-helix domain-containing protein [Roseococcus pinisoli]|uniref:Helix-turn-helix domain-containing protein n=1 Tax=Roseococcus pinisoli TaxID=2835040 RepID=A0ABS5QCJ6_9PROT|nr:helix-turn-helix domain-containing protein [Roseococcus pinisoli]MBS7811411.1 helix-turn-helix domain-containing protein [Roseococcus pinisoli]